MREKRNRIISGWLAIAAGCSAFLFIVLVLAGTAQAAIPTALAADDATPTPTANNAPASGLAVAADGFDAWCAPQGYALTKAAGPDAPDYARKLTKLKDQFKVPIPAAYCVLSFKFTQPVPEGTILTMYSAKVPFLRLPLKAADGNPNVGWTIVRHTYVVNPPKWSVTYQLGLTGPNKEDLWSNNVTFAKPLPKMCQFGGYPDPVTMWCVPYDRWETEPHPDAVYHFPRTPNP